MMSGIPLILDFGTRRCDPCAYVVFWALLKSCALRLYIFLVTLDNLEAYTPGHMQTNSFWFQSPI